jgi:hypothetical protein
MSTEILRPNSDDFAQLNRSTGSYNYACVDEATKDEADYVSALSVSAEVVGLTDRYGMPNSAIGEGPISSVVIKAYAKYTGLSATLNLKFHIGGSYYAGSDQNLTTSTALYTRTAATNPATGVAWTWSDIDALIPAFYLAPVSDSKTPTTAIIYQVWVEVNYTEVSHNSKTYTLDGTIQKKGATKTFTIDGAVMKTDSKTYTLDGALQKLGAVKAFDIDGAIISRSIAEFEIDGALVETASKTFDIDGNIILRSTIDFEADGILKGPEKPFSADGCIVDTDSKSFDVDGLIVTRSQADLDVDGYISQELSKEITIDGIIVSRDNKDLDIDGVIVSRAEKSFTIDGHLSQDNVVKTIDLDGRIGAPLKSVVVDTTPHIKIVFKEKDG